MWKPPPPPQTIFILYCGGISSLFSYLFFFKKFSTGWLNWIFFSQFNFSKITKNNYQKRKNVRKKIRVYMQHLNLENFFFFFLKKLNVVWISKEISTEEKLFFLLIKLMWIFCFSSFFFNFSHNQNLINKTKKKRFFFSGSSFVFFLFVCLFIWPFQDTDWNIHWNIVSKTWIKFSVNFSFFLRKLLLLLLDANTPLYFSLPVFRSFFDNFY